MSSYDSGGYLSYTEYKAKEYQVLCKRGKRSAMEKGKWTFTRFKLYDVVSISDIYYGTDYRITNNDGASESMSRREFEWRFTKF